MTTTPYTSSKSPIFRFSACLASQSTGRTQGRKKLCERQEHTSILDCKIQPKSTYGEPAENEGNGSRFGAVIEKIECLYMGKTVVMRKISTVLFLMMMSMIPEILS